MKNDNKLIAEFMGYSIRENNSITVPEVGTFPIQDILRKFSTSWDWLMPVVEKIEQVNEGVPKQMLHVNLYSEKREVYQAVVEFIKSN
tara:strand:+ start:254 stop:517 length:264 start_codon:yes stop_codon:yes gene_type:complete